MKKITWPQERLINLIYMAPQLVYIRLVLLPFWLLPKLSKISVWGNVTLLWRGGGVAPHRSIVDIGGKKVRVSVRTVLAEGLTQRRQELRFLMGRAAWS